MRCGSELRTYVKIYYASVYIQKSEPLQGDVTYITIQLTLN